MFMNYVVWIFIDLLKQLSTFIGINTQTITYNFQAIHKIHVCLGRSVIFIYAYHIQLAITWLINTRTEHVCVFSVGTQRLVTSHAWSMDKTLNGTSVNDAALSVELTEWKRTEPNIHRDASFDSRLLLNTAN